MVVLWVLNKSDLPTFMQNMNGITVLNLPVASWALPCNVSSNSTWNGRHMFDIGYYIMGRWRLTFAFEFAKSLGFKYVMQFDDDAFLNQPMSYNLSERMSQESKKHAVIGRHPGKEFKFDIDGLPEFTKNWIDQHNYKLQGELLKHIVPSELSALSSANWDREYYPGYFLIFSLDFWYQSDVQDYLQAILLSNNDIQKRWQEQGVMNMIRLVFLKQEEVLHLDDIDVQHGRHPKLFQAICAAYPQSFAGLAQNELTVSMLSKLIKDGPIDIIKGIGFLTSHQF